jgi:hypothetical protein
MSEKPVRWARYASCGLIAGLASTMTFAAPAPRRAARRAAARPTGKRVATAPAPTPLRLVVTPSTALPGEAIRITLAGQVPNLSLTVGQKPVPVKQKLDRTGGTDLEITVPRELTPGKQPIVVEAGTAKAVPKGAAKKVVARGVLTIKESERREVYLEEQPGDGAAICAGRPFHLRLAPALEPGLIPTVTLVPSEAPQTPIPCRVEPTTDPRGPFAVHPLGLPLLDKPRFYTAVVSAATTTVKRRIQAYSYPTQPTITAVTPPQVFIDRGKPDVHPATVTVSGTGFAAPPGEIELLLDGEVVAPAWQVDPEGRSFTAKLPPGTKGGTRQVAARVWGVGAAPPSAPLNLVVVPGSDWRLPGENGGGDWRALALSLLSSFGLLWMVAAAWRKYTRRQDLGPLWACLYEPANQTLSLSRFQFLWWLGCFVFAYLFLAWGHFFIDARPALPSFSDSLYAFGISLGTLVAAQLTTSTRGVKGAGARHPSWSDLFISGGAVALDRVQQLVWTLLAGLGFVAITLQMYYRSMVLPDIPEQLIALMGLSSLGYLGGKLARKPGPVIQKVLWDPASHVLRIEGMQLSSKATVTIGPPPGAPAGTLPYQPAREQIVTPDGQPATADGSVSALVVSNPSEGTQLLDAQLAGAAPDAVGNRTLHIVVTNPEGEFAAWDRVEEGIVAAPPAPVAGRPPVPPAQLPPPAPPAAPPAAPPVPAAPPGAGGAAALAVDPAQLRPAVAGQPYRAALRATGGKEPYRWTDMQLPDGLMLDEAGTLTGTLGAADNVTVSVLVTDADENQVAADLPLSVTGG